MYDDDQHEVGHVFEDDFMDEKDGDREDNTITDGGVAPQCTFAGPT